MFQRRQRQDSARQLERLDEQRKVALVQELQDAGVKINQIRAKLQGVAEKIQYTRSGQITARTRVWRKAGRYRR